MNTHVSTVFVSVVFLGCSNPEQQIRLSDVDTSEVRLPSPIDAVLGASHTTELLSINPEPLMVDPEFTKLVPADQKFHGFEILGRVQLDPNSEDALINALKAGIATSSDVAAACFNPRHALRIADSDTVIDVLICFECAQIYVYESDERIATLGTSDAPREFFDTAIRRNNLRMPTRPSL